MQDSVMGDWFIAKQFCCHHALRQMTQSQQKDAWDSADPFHIEGLGYGYGTCVRS